MLRVGFMGVSRRSRAHWRQMPDLRVGVLGTLTVHVDGHPRVIAPGRQRAVLACLLVHVGHPVDTDTLIEAAWGQERPHNPPKALRTVVSRLRKVLGPESITMTPGGYRLSVGAVDSEEFLALVEQARSAPPGEARALLGRALALWRGPAFGEYADAPFGMSLTQSLDQARMDAIEAHASALIQTGDPAAAVARLQDLLADQPFREHAVELLVTALYHAGRQTEALARLRTHRELLASELGLDWSPALAALESSILGHALSPIGPGEAGPPAWLDTSTAFVGREEELDDLASAVADNRLCTVTGPGGVGKSRLVAEALPVLHRRLGLPVTVVELASTARGQVVTRVVDRIGLRLGTEPDAAPGDLGPVALVEGLVEFLTAAPRLLVLDNCEHVLAEVASLAESITRRCRGLRVLATSRRRLGRPTEQVLPLEPLGVPDLEAAPGRQGASASVRLFADRVRRLRPTFALTAENTPEVAELCRRCEGLPLALELAASRTATSGVREVLARLPTDIVGEAGDLAAGVAWSYDLLAPDQQRVLDCLSVFTGDFSQEAVTGLLSHLPERTADPGAALAELVESSLVVHHETAGGSRFRLLEMVRAYAAQRLQETGDAQEVGLAHGWWVRDMVTVIEADWSRLDGAVVAARITAYSAEISSALRWALRTGDLVLASQISRAVALCLHWTPGLDLRDLMIEVGERALERPGPEVAGGVAAAAFSLGERGDPGRARRLAHAALEMSEDRGSSALAVMTLAVSAMYAGDLDDSSHWFRTLAQDPALTGEANCSLALIAAYSGDLTTAREHAEVALAAGASGSDASAAFARYAAGEVEALTDPARGAQLLARAADEADRVEAEQVSRVSRVALFALLVRQGRHEEAVTLGLRLVGDLRRLGAWTQVWTLARMLAELLTETGAWSEAAYFLGAADGAAGAPPPLGQDIERYAALRADLARHLGDRVLEQILSLAATTPRAQVLSRAEQLLAHLAGPPRPPAGSGVGKE